MLSYCLCLLILLMALGGPCERTTASPRKPTVRIGSMNFSEQIILAELYAQALEADGYRVERKLRMGNREVDGPLGAVRSTFIRVSGFRGAIHKW